MGIDYTPKQIVGQLDKYIIGQQQAKRSVAVALRNRYRRMKLDETMKEEIVPKNILMIGPTGVGKTEIARRLAKLVGAPFVKVEATKFTEVGYVGRDVESMVRDLVEMAVRMVKEEKMTEVMGAAEQEATKKLVKLLVPSAKKQSSVKNPFEMLFPNQSANSDTTSNDQEKDDEIRSKRQRIEHQLALGELEDHMVSIEIEEIPPSMFDMLQGSGMEQMGMNMQDALGQFMPSKKKKRKLPVSEARKVITQQEAQKLVDMDEVAQEAVKRAEETGILFIDEIDKVAGKQETTANVSREGVQRDV
ncbi:HslU--HslV peptidase ATPase subunit, partial [Oceanobacillus massiliensis]|uniref:HslU--HslV peptidase ATPase subunit n=1 Tax=Oceanobacillus massiliensis TaxID=1465765 RepID=UPI003016619D